MNGIILLALFTGLPTPIPARVDGPVELATLSIGKARELDGMRGRFIVWRSSIADEHEGQNHFDAWHVRGVHCLVRLVEGQDVPDAELFTVEGVLRIWDVESYRIDGGRFIEGWTMIRIENATPLPPANRRPCPMIHRAGTEARARD